MTIHFFVDGNYLKSWPNWSGVIPQIGDKVELNFGDYNEEKMRYKVVDRLISGTAHESIQIYLEWVDKEGIEIVNELMKGVAIVDTIDNYAGHQTINTIRFVGEDEDKPRPLPCKYYHVWLKAAKEDDL